MHWASILEEMVRFAPDLVIISAGFDAHKDDPLADCALEVLVGVGGFFIYSVLCCCCVCLFVCLFVFFVLFFSTYSSIDCKILLIIFND